MATKRTNIKLPTQGYQAPYSDGVLVGDTLYISGRVGFLPDTGGPPEELEEEIRMALDGIQVTLAAAGMKMENLVWVQVYCSDVRLFDRFNEVYRTYFADSVPARAFVGVGNLIHGAHFQVQGVAVKS